jgi:hypothetical protein
VKKKFPDVGNASIQPFLTRKWLIIETMVEKFKNFFGGRPFSSSLFNSLILPFV